MKNARNLRGGRESRGRDESYRVEKLETLPEPPQKCGRKEFFEVRGQNLKGISQKIDGWGVKKRA